MEVKGAIFNTIFWRGETHNNKMSSMPLILISHMTTFRYEEMVTHKHHHKSHKPHQLDVRRLCARLFFVCVLNYKQMQIRS